VVTDRRGIAGARGRVPPLVAGLLVLTLRVVALGADAAPAEPVFVGRAACAPCHEAEDRRWRGSHHDLAMQVADDKTVLGNFRGTTFTHRGVTSTFARRGERFAVRTDGPDAKLHDYTVAYTFGVAPLQQYLVGFPDGRYQALSLAWDARPSAAGGQRWFHLYPDERFRPNDPLHWTGRLQNWNYMCAECHSTGVRKGYDPATRRYRTTWKEVDVACEACHGPGSRHVAWAKERSADDPTKGLAVRFDERKGVEWAIDPRSGNARRSVARATDTEVQTCARCHARRSELSEDYRWGRPLMDTHLPTLLEPGLYHADGQIDGEVYEYGSFVQSRMYRQGVTCSDCHEPHDLKLRAEGNGVCLRCHSAATYETERHHFHRLGTPGSACVDCHMPAKTYMLVDPRRDHGFRVPRPDLSVRLGTPNPCTGCHRDEPAGWAAEKVRAWYGHDARGSQQYAAALHAARTNASDAEALLTALLRDGSQPAIARATAASELGLRLGPASLPAVRAALGDADPLVRHAALEAIEPLPPADRWRLARPLLVDPVRAVRIGAASLLAGAAPKDLPADARADLERATDEFRAAQRLNADQPEAHVNLGNLETKLGDGAAAAREYRAAFALDPDWVPAYVNLADLLRQERRDDEGAQVLRTGLAHVPDAASLHHALGLLEVRRKNLPAALESLRRAAELAPDDARFAYVWAVALEQAGRRPEARAAVDAALRHSPGDRGLRELRSQLGD
jgi:tetratricopeptide (TPR) repeat protein/nitrate/TMAO reductase-like tetraheme cytochrome c subunit